MSKEETKQLILDTIHDLVMDFACYDRREDEELTIDVLYTAFGDGIITLDECVQAFRDNMECNFNQPAQAGRELDREVEF